MTFQSVEIVISEFSFFLCFPAGTNLRPLLLRVKVLKTLLQNYDLRQIFGTLNFIAGQEIREKLR